MLRDSGLQEEEKGEVTDLQTSEGDCVEHVKAPL